jgi:tetratricopeptide (TPR) repeat protein
MTIKDDSSNPAYADQARESMADKLTRDQERINKALTLARRGLAEEGIPLIRPLIAERGKWPNALAAMGYCFEGSGNPATAIYLYKKALVQQPQNKEWLELLAKAKKKSAARLQAAEKTKPGFQLVILAFFLAIGAALFVSMVVVDEIANFITTITGFQPPSDMPLFVGAAGLLAFLSLLSLSSWTIKLRHYGKALRELKKEDLSDGNLVCPMCGLSHRTCLCECPFCGTPRIPPLPDEPPPLPAPEGRENWLTPSQHQAEFGHELARLIIHAGIGAGIGAGIYLLASSISYYYQPERFPTPYFMQHERLHAVNLLTKYLTYCKKFKNVMIILMAYCAILSVIIHSLIENHLKAKSRK